MRDEMDSRIWLAHHADFAAFVAAAIDTVKVSLQRLNEIEFDAPWRRPGSPSNH
jgi:hypothetical protein